MANNIDVKDAAGATRTMKTTETAGVNVAHHNLDSSAIIGAVDETAPGTDTASSGLNGRLQRIAQRLTTLIGATAPFGPAAPSASVPVIPAGYQYETVAASQTAQVMGGSGATGDFIFGILCVPATTSPGNVILLDNATSITVFAGGGSSVSNLVPFLIPLNLRSVSGAWKITTGANISVIGIGIFSA